MTVLCQIAGLKASLSQSGATSLDNFAAVALQHCLTVSSPLDAARTYEPLQRLCPEDGWHVPAEQATETGTQPPPPMIGPLPAQQAATAAVLLHGLLKRDDARKAAADCIVRFVCACAATLARVMKPQQADDKVCQDSICRTPLLVHYHLNFGELRFFYLLRLVLHSDVLYTSACKYIVLHSDMSESCLTDAHVS